ncbi:DUF1833 family protein [Campylobacter sp. FOBRC14]|uniref:DUF1833 family protein n=1 Tax=Campylobacter sp. FOBRC14 TaxID=936554 RepID=UPI00027A3658|nr:DUF1833 family protein [Campylobacter sp. FOBRC14]EJP76182.1 phage minor tail protein L [Campylobacter sp. FOBRC14]
MTLNTIKDLNALDSEGVLLVALEIAIPDTPIVRIVRNSENIIFKNNEFIAFPFNISEIKTAKGEVPQFQLQIDNTSRAMQNYVQMYDRYLRVHGVDNSAIKATVYVLNTKDLNESILEEYFELTDFNSDSQYVTFNLGSQNLFNMSYPIRKMYKDYCPFKFKDECCGYTGNATGCNKSLADCRAKNNSVRFGGFLGIQGGYKR